jgi:hypothetical protein
MVLVTLWPQFLLLVLVLKQSDADNEQCRALQVEIVKLEACATEITKLKHEYEQFFGKCKVSIYVCIYIYIFIYVFAHVHTYINPRSLERYVLIITELKQKTKILASENYVGGYYIAYVSSM